MAGKKRLRRAQFAQVRKSAGYTQESLAEALGIERTAPSRWETGIVSPAAHLRPQIAKLFEISQKRLNELLWPEGADHSTPDVEEPSVEQLDQPPQAPPASAAMPQELVPDKPPGHESVCQPPGELLLPVIMNGHPVLIPVTTGVLAANGLDALLAEQTGCASVISDEREDEVRLAVAAMQDLAAFPGSPDELASLLMAGLALFEAISSGLVVQENETHDQLDMWRRLVDTMKRRGLLQLLGQLAAGSTMTSPAIGGLRLLGLDTLNPDERDRVAQVILSPERVDKRVIGHIETILWACKQQDDTFGPQAVLNTVLDQALLVQDVLLPACPDQLRPRLLSLYSSLCSSAGWYLFDLDNVALAWEHFEKARKAAHEARHTELSVFTLCNMSYAAAWHGRTHTGLDLAASAQALAGKTGDTLVQVCVADHAAQAYAVDGQYDECMTELDKAQTVFTTAAGQAPPASLAYYYNAGFLANHRSDYLLRLGKFQQAVASARAGLALYDRSFARDFAFCTLHLGKALIQSQEIDEAAVVVGEAATLAAENRSTRLVKELQAARTALQPWWETQAVRELDEVLVGWRLSGDGS